jgi:hypothetical protein
MNIKLLVTALMTLSTAAHANVKIHNTLEQELVVECTMPNGAVKKDTMSAATDSVDDGICELATGVKAVAVRVLDDEGTALWSAKVKDNTAYVLVAGTKGVEAVAAGALTVSKESKWVSLMNLTGEDLTVDLFGTGGVGSHRGLKPPKRFHPKHALKLHARETYFTMTAQGPDGAAEFDMDRVTAGNYYVIWKVPRSGKYRAVNVGRL